MIDDNIRVYHPILVGFVSVPIGDEKKCKELKEHLDRARENWRDRELERLQKSQGKTND